MSQTLHIFRKDIRHHWPEILVSLLLLAAFVWHERAEWSGNFPSFSLLQILFSFVDTLLPLSWCLMIVRLVHEESLVGDRQFWVTRPYEWPQSCSFSSFSSTCRSLSPSCSSSIEPACP